MFEPLYQDTMPTTMRPPPYRAPAGGTSRLGHLAGVWAVHPTMEAAGIPCDARATHAALVLVFTYLGVGYPCAC